MERYRLRQDGGRGQWSSLLHPGAYGYKFQFPVTFLCMANEITLSLNLNSCISDDPIHPSIHSIYLFIPPIQLFNHLMVHWFICSICSTPPKDYVSQNSSIGPESWPFTIIGACPLCLHVWVWVWVCREKSELIGVKFLMCREEYVKWNKLGNVC